MTEYEKLQKKHREGTVRKYDFTDDIAHYVYQGERSEYVSVHDGDVKYIIDYFCESAGRGIKRNQVVNFLEEIIPDIYDKRDDQEEGYFFRQIVKYDKIEVGNFEEDSCLFYKTTLVLQVLVYVSKYLEKFRNQTNGKGALEEPEKLSQYYANEVENEKIRLEKLHGDDLSFLDKAIEFYSLELEKEKQLTSTKKSQVERLKKLNI